MSTAEHFVNGISSISNNLANGTYSIERTTNRTGSNHSSPNQQPTSIYEYNLAELALLDNQRAQQYIQQQQARHRHSNNNTSAKQSERNIQENINTDSQPLSDNSNQLNLNGNQLEVEEDDDSKPPPLPPLPSKHLLKRNNYYANIYSAPPQYTEPDFSVDNLATSSNHHSLNYSNPPQYTPSTSTNNTNGIVPIYSQTANLENEFNGCVASNSTTVNNNKSLASTRNNHHHHLPHHPNQNSLLSSMDGIRIQLARTKKQIAAVANTASQLNSTHLSQNGQNSATVSSAAQNLVANLVPNQIRAPQIQRSAEMQVSLKGWLYRLEGPALKQWKRRWFVLGEYCLFYYKDSSEQKMIGSVLLPSYTVSTCSTSEDGISRKFAFKLEHHNLKTHYLAAECAESQMQIMRLISLAATMQLNAVNYEQLTDGTISSALTAANISRNRPDSQDMMNMILNGTRSMNNNENNKNFVNTNQDTLDQVDQFNNTASSSLNNSSLYNAHQRKDSSNLDNSNHDNLTKLSDLNESGSESGFANYKPRRQSKTNSELESSVSNAYNSVGLPSTSLASGAYSIYSSTAPHKPPGQQQAQPIYAPKRPQPCGYVNAPPKPRRHQPQSSGNMNQDFETYSSNNPNDTFNGTNKPQLLHSNGNLMHSASTQKPDLIDANGYPAHDLYSIPPTNHAQRQQQQRNGSFSIHGDEQSQINENLYLQHHRRTLTRQNASDSGRITPIDDHIF